MSATKLKTIVLAVGLVAVIGVVIRYQMRDDHKPTPQIRGDASAQQSHPEVLQTSPVEQVVASPSKVPDVSPSPSPPPAVAPTRAEPLAVEAEIPEPLIPEPLARLALSFVGVDSGAEWVWILAINDPNLPPRDRQNLIEDLNEDGFPDKKNITEDDLPLIVNRIELIEQLAPDAIDDVNAAAFAEAYKDLLNMYARLVGP